MEHAAVHRKSILERIRWLDQLSVEHSRSYCSSEAYLERMHYFAQHPCLILAFKCMDGRIHLPYITNTPLGIIRPFRNLGGRFDIGWPYLGELVTNTVDQAVHAGRKVLILITYHYSKGDIYRGCAGFSFKCEVAMSSAYVFKEQLEDVFGANHRIVYPIVVGVETDEDALIFHGVRDEVLNLADFSTENAAERSMKELLIHRLAQLFPDMPANILSDLLPLAEGNMRHILDIRATERRLNVDHNEWILCVGTGFDFLHVPNTALIVGPYSPNIDDPIATAARIIISNMNESKIPDDGFVLLASAPYETIGVDYRRAIQKAKFLSCFAAETIKREVPEFYSKMFRKTCVLNWATRALEGIELIEPLR